MKKPVAGRNRSERKQRRAPAVESQTAEQPAGMECDSVAVQAQGQNTLAWLASALSEPGAGDPNAAAQAFSTGESLDVTQVGTRHQEWLARMASATEVCVDASALRSIDTAGLQLLLALRTQALAQQRPFRWRGADNPALRQPAELLGVVAALGL